MSVLLFLYHSPFWQVQVTSKLWIWFSIWKLAQIWGPSSSGRKCRASSGGGNSKKKVACQHEHSRNRAAVNTSLQDTDLLPCSIRLHASPVQHCSWTQQSFHQDSAQLPPSHSGTGSLQQSLQPNLFCDPVICDHGWKTTAAASEAAPGLTQTHWHGRGRKEFIYKVKAKCLTEETNAQPFHSEHCPADTAHCTAVPAWLLLGMAAFCAPSRKNCRKDNFSFTVLMLVLPVPRVVQNILRVAINFQCWLQPFGVTFIHPRPSGPGGLWALG